jgi:peptidoglycan/xylan/chitin deacetylase (PgdA/CDA1 family)
MVSLLIKMFVDLFLWIFGKNKLGILTYHRVGSSGDALAMDETLFEQHLIWTKRYFNPISLSKGLALQEKGCLPRGSIAITIDDGYVDSYSTIFPLLQKYELTATFFISTIGFEKGYLWDELVAFSIMKTKQQELTFNNKYYTLKTYDEKLNCLTSCLSEIKYKSNTERNLLIEQLIAQTNNVGAPQQFLSEEQINVLHNSGMGIGAHTHSHPILLQENESTALYEIKQSKIMLENILKIPVEYFAYPNGKFGLDFDSSHIKMVQDAGFLAGLSTDKGVLVNRKSDGFKIKRFTPWDETELKFALRLALNYCQ